jgi:hypothetical protein
MLIINRSGEDRSAQITGKGVGAAQKEELAGQ